MSGKIRVLLLGGWQDSAMLILKHFRHSGRYSFYVADRWEKSVSRLSKHNAGFILLPDFAKDEEAYVGALIGGYKEHRIDVLLPIPQDEMIITCRHKERLLREGLRFLVPDHQVLAKTIDKYELGRHAAANGIPYPATYCPAETTGDEILAKEGLSLMTKLRRGTGQHDQRISHDRPGFLRHLARVVSKYGPDEIIVQKFIPGLETEAMYTVGALCDQCGELVTVVPTKKVRSRPYTGGSGVCVKTVAEEDVIDLCRRTVRSFGSWRGIMDIEVKRDITTGRLYLIEINPRPWGMPMLAVMLSGVNIIDLWIRAALGECVEKSCSFTAGVFSVDLITDYLLFMDLIKDCFTPHVRSAAKTLKSYVYPYFSSRRHNRLLACTDLDFFDPLPFFYKMYRLRRYLMYSVLPTAKGRRDRA